ncbi:glycoside hydrolase family 26 protein [Micromonospora maris]|uniref:Beta-mannanase n=1 Tax=Micromonospora maris TaxID=1003110 RepID=A0A9X0I0B1_9ACTN|nr:glycosyl hydrolase [Micromonospora maris]AEB45023.1 beta-mannanase-like protein [Micromonospora maris AB-18-032]KUJ44465.1 beta-mannanase [Micromonospora maris]
MARLTLPRVAMSLVGALLLAYAFAIAPGTGSGRRESAPADQAAVREPSPSPSPPEVFPPAEKVFIGIATKEGPHDFTPVDAFTATAKHHPQVMLFGSGWATDTFDRTLFDAVSSRGMLPMLAWEPWDYRLDEQARKKGAARGTIDRLRSRQPDYRLSHITRGDFDDYLRSWAEGIKALDYPVAIRFAHEMNGNWYPWCETANGNQPGDYVKAWRHLHDLFMAAGTTNVIWVWSPNARWDGSTPKLSALYPGDDYVDWIGISGYYGMGAFSKYRSFDAIFKETIGEIRAFSAKPLVITETAASDIAGRKAEWITETFRSLPEHEGIIGLIWFEVNKERDWRIVSSPAVSAAFAQAVSDPRYRFTWSPEMLPRTEPAD